MRRARRFRKTPCRANRMNRKRGGLPPSTKARWQWKLRVIRHLAKIIPISEFVVEDIKAATKGQRRWDVSFSPLQIGKQWFYDQLEQIGFVHLLEGWQTKELRDTHDLHKTKKKMSEVFEAHCVDSWVLANWLVGGHIKPDNQDLMCLTPLRFHRRQLHVLQPAKSGIRKPYGSTKSQGFERGSLVKHVKLGVMYVGGQRKDRLSLHAIETGKRVTQIAKPLDYKDRILIAERINGKRILREELPEYVFYYTHPQATDRYKTIFGDNVKISTFHETKKFRGALHNKKEEEKEGKTKVFESDINPVFRYLAKHYMGADTPKLNVCFFDIEVDFDASRGYAPPDDPFAAITAIALYNTHEETLYTLVLCPPTLTMEEGQAIVDEFPNTALFDNEVELLQTFLQLIDDVDVYGTWNGEGFDIPYLVNRVKLLMGDDATRAFCLWDQLPKEREYVKFMRPFKTYELVGRVHLDYLLLYQKHNTQQQHSYRLDFIGEIEVGETKTPYEGTLDQLYKEDFKKFIEYNRQDVMLLVKIDKKKKFIDLANQIAHENCILLKTTMGTVSFVEQAIINEMHKMGFVLPDRKERENDNKLEDEYEERTPVVGAHVAKPKVGMNYEIGCIDINSLYPSAIRALNMSPETIIGQVRQTETMALITKRVASGTPRAEAWEGIFAMIEVDHMHAKDDTELVVDFEDGEVWKTNGAGLYEYIFNPKNNVCITANGTIFRTDKEGMIPALLAAWYAERKHLQNCAKQAEDAARLATNDEDRNEQLRLYAFYDQRQYAGKIRLNATYGAILQPACRFFDERLGQSTTLTGRSIVKHMNAKVNEIVTGEYDHQGNTIVYIDTDSNPADTIIHTNNGRMTMEGLFELAAKKWQSGNKEYASDERLEVLTYDPKIDRAILKPFSYVYRHKVSKARWRVTDEFGNSVEVTNDHSIMVEREGVLIEAKASEILTGDVIISVNTKN
ncbi:unnamed protein product [Sphagnum tenellum]